MTIAGIITVAISLFLFGGILLVAGAVDHGTAQWKHGVELEIFMKVEGDRPPDAERSKTRSRRPTRRSSSSKFLSQQDAYSDLQAVRPTSPRSSRATTPDDLPASFRVVADRTAELTTAVAGRVHQDRPGVDKVITADKQIKALLHGDPRIRRAFFSRWPACCSRRRCS